MTNKKHQYFFESELNGSIEACFEAVLAPEIMKQWIPDVKDISYDHSAAEAPYNSGSVRSIVMPNGSIIQERINLYQPPHQVGYEIASMGFLFDALLSNYRGLISFKVINENRTLLTWQGDFDCKGLQKITEPLVRLMVRKVIKKMVDNVHQFFNEGTSD